MKEFYICRNCLVGHHPKMDAPAPTFCLMCAACSWIILPEDGLRLMVPYFSVERQSELARLLSYQRRVARGFNP